MFTRIDHVGIACRDLEATIARYTAAFDLTVLGRETNEAQGVHEAMLVVADSATGRSCVQLLQPTRPDTPVGKFLETRGEGLHHVAYGVDDIVGSLSALRESGAELIDETPRHGFGGSAIAFIHPRSAGGVLTELVEAVRRS
ncbi:MAG TPA: methylmalonyl-CoA epimerase [Mycobacteriales bacterium]|nr:methylmalonyl-CoA epimerase [Mycobacteriales bacterium]